VQHTIIIIFFYTVGINVPEGDLKKLVKMKRLGMSKIPCGHKRAYCLSHPAVAQSLEGRGGGVR